MNLLPHPILHIMQALSISYNIMIVKFSQLINKDNTIKP